MLNYKKDPYIQSLSTYLENLTLREKEVFLLMLEGYDSREISAKLFIAHSTTKNHLSSILRKTRMPSAFKLTARVLNHLLKSSVNV